MRPPIVLGIVLAAIVIALGFFAPYLDTTGARSAARANEQAELARRDYVRLGMDAARLNAAVDPAGTKADAAALAAAIERNGDALRKQASDAQASLSRAQTVTREAGLPPLQATTIAPSTGGLQQALGSFEQALKADAGLLTEALAAAKSGVSEKSDSISAQYAVGIGEYMRAVSELVEAERIRTEQLSAQSTLLGLAARWKQVRAAVDQFKGFQTAPVMARLQDDLAEFTTLRTEANAAMEAVQRDVTERDQGLSRVDAELKDARAALLAHERQGFKPGDDASFLAFRSKYVELTNKLKDLQEEEHELRFGGHVGGTLSGLDQPGAPVEGGREVAPYAILTSQLERAKSRATLLSTAHIELENQVKYLDDLAKRAQGEAARLEAQLGTLSEQQQEQSKKIGELAASALAREGTALSAASAAVNAFKQSQAALSTWVRSARELQGNLDPERRNERLNLLLKDQYLEQIGSTAESAARILAGRISALQVESGSRTLADMQTLAQLNPDAGSAFDPAPFEKLVDAARGAGLDTLNVAKQNLEKASSAPPTTAWAPLGMLAAAQHLMGRIDVSQAETHRAAALATIQKAVEKREQSPYLTALVEFRDHLQGGAPEPLDAPADNTTTPADPNSPVKPATP